MKNKEIKKIQFGGWNKKDFSQIRNKVNSFDTDNERVRRHKKKKGCKFNTTGHIFKIDKIYSAKYFDSKIFNILSCKFCGKKDYKYGDIGVVGSTVPREGISKSSNLL